MRIIIIIIKDSSWCAWTLLLLVLSREISLNYVGWVKFKNGLTDVCERLCCDGHDPAWSYAGDRLPRVRNSAKKFITIQMDCTHESGGLGGGDGEWYWWARAKGQDQSSMGQLR